ncbi:MAG: hypothetical protein PHX83_02115 [Acidobacteriia bacterium]|nr:hypothetical protein [Terriglobia bacterium]
MNRHLAIFAAQALVFASVAFGQDGGVLRYNTWAFCPSGLKAFEGWSNIQLENDGKRTLADLLRLSGQKIRIESKSIDWKTDDAVRQRVRQILNGKPGTLYSAPLWAEGISFGSENIVASLERGEKIEIAGYHVCVQDYEKRFWYFRTEPVDGWKY